MKKYRFCFAFILMAFLHALNRTIGKLLPAELPSQWADSVNPKNPLPDYPRPQMQRSDWQNLNGLWQYSILPKSNDESIPASFQGNILVPFAVESALSGVGKTVGKDSILWY